MFSFLDGVFRDMTLTLRIVLIVASLLSCAWILINVRKAKVKTEDSVFWICFSFLLIIFAAFPGIVIWGAGVLGIESPANFIFLAIIFILIIKVFRMSVRISSLESKLARVAQDEALKNADK